MKKKWRIVDTNVAILANGTENDELVPVANQCIEEIQKITTEGGLVLDEGDRIFDEYRDNLSLSGQPGVGDLFMKWVHDHRWQEELCQRVRVTCTDEANQVFAEFPPAPDLAAFDVDDRKFVAVSKAAVGNPSILQAVDYKWWGWKEALKKAGVKVVFLDPKLAEKKYAEHLAGK